MGLDEAVTQRQPPYWKAWKTVGERKLALVLPAAGNAVGHAQQFRRLHADY